MRVAVAAFGVPPGEQSGFRIYAHDRAFAELTPESIAEIERRSTFSGPAVADKDFRLCVSSYRLQSGQWVVAHHRPQASTDRGWVIEGRIYVLMPRDAALFDWSPFVFGRWVRGHSVDEHFGTKDLPELGCLPDPTSLPEGTAIEALSSWVPGTLSVALTRLWSGQPTALLSSRPVLRPLEGLLSCISTADRARVSLATYYSSRSALPYLLLQTSDRKLLEETLPHVSIVDPLMACREVPHAAARFLAHAICERRFDVVAEWVSWQKKAEVGLLGGRISPSGLMRIVAARVGRKPSALVAVSEAAGAAVAWRDASDARVSAERFIENLRGLSVTAEERLDILRGEVESPLGTAAFGRALEPILRDWALLLSDVERLELAAAVSASGPLVGACLRSAVGPIPIHESERALRALATIQARAHDSVRELSRTVLSEVVFALSEITDACPELVESIFAAECASAGGVGPASAWWRHAMDTWSRPELAWRLLAQLVNERKKDDSGSVLAVDEACFAVLDVRRVQEVLGEVSARNWARLAPLFREALLLPQGESRRTILQTILASRPDAIVCTIEERWPELLSDLLRANLDVQGDDWRRAASDIFRWVDQEASVDVWCRLLDIWNAFASEYPIQVQPFADAIGNLLALPTLEGRVDRSEMPPEVRPYLIRTVLKLLRTLNAPPTATVADHLLAVAPDEMQPSLRVRLIVSWLRAPRSPDIEASRRYVEQLSANPSALNEIAEEVLVDPPTGFRSALYLARSGFPAELLLDHLEHWPTDAARQSIQVLLCVRLVDHGPTTARALRMLNRALGANFSVVEVLQFCQWSSEGSPLADALHCELARLLTKIQALRDALPGNAVDGCWQPVLSKAEGLLRRRRSPARESERPSHHEPTITVVAFARHHFVGARACIPSLPWLEGREIRSGIDRLVGPYEGYLPSVFGAFDVLHVPVRDESGVRQVRLWIHWALARRDAGLPTLPGTAVAHVVVADPKTPVQDLEWAVTQLSLTATEHCWIHALVHGGSGGEVFRKRAESILEERTPSFWQGLVKRGPRIGYARRFAMVDPSLDTAMKDIVDRVVERTAELAKKGIV